MKRYFLILLILFSLSGKAQISKIEHFFISSPQAKELYNLFTTQFDLPVVWNYQTFGQFSSGGVTLGNVVYEFVNVGPDQTRVFHGIAFEPKQTATEIEPILDAANVSHGSVNKNSNFIDDQNIDVGWSTISLSNLLPSSIELFICDYHNRESVKEGRVMAVNELVDKSGGALGVIILEEIIIGTSEYERYNTELIKVPGVKKQENVFKFSEGPDLNLINSDMPFFKLLIRVNSIANARKKLTDLKFVLKDTDIGFIIDDKNFGIQIELFE